MKLKPIKFRRRKCKQCRAREATHYGRCTACYLKQLDAFQERSRKSKLIICATLALLTFAALADDPMLPPCCNTNSPPTPTGFDGKPPASIVWHGAHFKFDWNRATNSYPHPSNAPLVSMVFTNNQAEWSTNMIGNTNIWANNVSIYSYGWWMVVIWFDPNCTNREPQFSEFPYVTNSWESGGIQPAPNSNPIYPHWTQVYNPKLPKPDNTGYFRLKRKDFGIQQ